MTKNGHVVVLHVSAADETGRGFLVLFFRDRSSFLFLFFFSFFSFFSIAGFHFELLTHGRSCITMLS